MTAIRKYWGSLSPRERLIAGSGGVLFVVIILYSLIWVPMQDRLVRLRNQVQVQVQDLAWMQQQSSAVRVLRKNSAVKGKTGDLPLLTIIDQTAKALKIRDRIKQIQPGKEEGTARVWFDKIVFEDWLKWLDRVSMRGITVKQVSITRSADIPRVNVRLELYKH